MKFPRLSIKENLFFYIGLFILSISIFCVKVEYIQTYISSLKIISFVFFGLNILINIKKYKLSFTKIIAFIVLLIIGIISFFTTKDYLIFYTLIILISAYGLDFEKTVKYDLIIKIITILLIMSSYFLGATNEMEIHRLDGSLRYSFGFSHPNTLAVMILFCYLSYIYLNRNKINFKKILLGIVLNFFIIYTTDSRTTFLTLGVFILIIIFRKYFKKICNNRYIYIVVKSLFIILGCISVVFSIRYSLNDDFMIKINDALSNRVSIQNYYINNYDVKIFGQFIDYTVSLDNLYMRVLINYGVTGFLVFATIYNSLIKKAYIEKNYIIYIIFMIISVYCLAENVIFCIYYNIFIVYLISKKDEIQHEEQFDKKSTLSMIKIN